MNNKAIINTPPRFRQRLSRAALLGPLALLGLLIGCAGAPLERDALPTETAQCLDRFLALDTAIDEADARDHGEHRPSGFPWLRSNRLLASLGQELNAQAPATDDDWSDWLDAMASLDAQARRWELANLSNQAPDAEAIEQEMEALGDCREALNEHLLAREELQHSLQHEAQVPDDYKTGRRWLGLYPLSRLFVLSGVNRLHQDQAESLKTPAEAEAGRWQSYQAGIEQPAEVEIQPPFQPPDSLLDKEPTDWTALFHRHAPIWRIDEAGEFDRLGRPYWAEDGTVQIDTRHATEFRYISFTRFEGALYPQLNYMVWLPERPRDGFFDLLGGHLDGAIWRVTLDRDGTLLAGESLHVCGCYYMVFPGDRLETAEQASGGEPIFVGPELPDSGEDARIRLTRASGNHYLIHLDAVSEPSDDKQELAVTAADKLRSLPHPDGRKGIYGEWGLVPGSERRERWLLWTMGVISPGAMRQPGRHAIAFAGRRHFDDPEILEESLRSSE